MLIFRKILRTYYMGDPNPNASKLEADMGSEKSSRSNNMNIFQRFA